MKLKLTGIVTEEMAQNAKVTEHIKRFDTVESIHEVILVLGVTRGKVQLLKTEYPYNASSREIHCQ